MFVVMDAGIKRTLTGDFDFLCDVLTTGREGEASGHAASTSSSIV
jgi:hypothetical protein